MTARWRESIRRNTNIPSIRALQPGALGSLVLGDTVSHYRGLPPAENNRSSVDYDFLRRWEFKGM
jgi:hypothetical protein